MLKTLKKNRRTNYSHSQNALFSNNPSLSPPIFFPPPLVQTLPLNSRAEPAMYSDRVATGMKRSIRDRLDVDFAPSRPNNLKRQRQNDDKWKHDLYNDVKGPQKSKTTVGPRDLRLKLQKRSAQQTSQASKGVVRDLREKLSGIMNSQPTNANPPKAKATLVIAKPIKRNTPTTTTTEATVVETKKVSVTASSSKKSQKKTELSVDGLLHSLGLEKYSIQFQAEEVDMTALKHMTDEDLKALGVPMGPRKKILLALESSG